MLHALLGVIIGVPAAFFCLRYVRSLLWEFTNADFIVILGAIEPLTIASVYCTHSTRIVSSSKRGWPA
jgi:hypothetical protein